MSAILAVAPASAASAPAALFLATAGGVDVGQQRQLACVLDRVGDLVLVTTAGAGDPPRANLALLGHELAQGGDVLVIDLVLLVAAERARLAPPATGSALLVSPPGRLPAASSL